MFDLRLSIGWYFIINSALLFLAGLVCGSLSLVQFQHQQLNLNLTWGAVLGLFGLLMIGLSHADKTTANKRSKQLVRTEAAAISSTASTPEPASLLRRM